MIKLWGADSRFWVKAVLEEARSEEAEQWSERWRWGDPSWAKLALSSKSPLYRANQSLLRDGRKEVRADRSALCDSMKLP